MAFWSTSCVLRGPLSDAAGWGRAEQTRRGPSGESGASVPLSTSPVNTANGGLLPQHSARTGPADTPDFLIGFVHFPSGRLVADRKGRKERLRERERE